MDVLYTILPAEEIFKDENKVKFNFQDIRFDGIEMQVEPIGWNQFKVIRLYSTDPSHYLEPSIQPGSIISF